MSYMSRSKPQFQGQINYDILTSKARNKCNTSFVVILTEQFISNTILAIQGHGQRSIPMSKMRKYDF